MAPVEPIDAVTTIASKTKAHELATFHPSSIFVLRKAAFGFSTHHLRPLIRKPKAIREVYVRIWGAAVNSVGALSPSDHEPVPHWPGSPLPPDTRCICDRECSIWIGDDAMLPV
jgi:hypothetical protein